MSEVLAALYERREVPPTEDSSLDVLEAAALGRVERLGVLLRSDPTLVSTRSPDGFTPLHYACFFDRPDAAALLLRAGADVGAVASNPSRVQPLHSAVASHGADVVRLLVAAGCDVDAAQTGGYTALHAAAMHRLSGVTALLLAAGAHPSRPSDDGKTAADYAE